VPVSDGIQPQADPQVAPVRAVQWEPTPHQKIGRGQNPTAADPPLLTTKLIDAFLGGEDGSSVQSDDGGVRDGGMMT
jgi:hypothetical protein